MSDGAGSDDSDEHEGCGEGKGRGLLPSRDSPMGENLIAGPPGSGLLPRPIASPSHVQARGGRVLQNASTGLWPRRPPRDAISTVIPFRGRTRKSGALVAPGQSAPMRKSTWTTRRPSLFPTTSPHFRATV